MTELTETQAAALQVIRAYSAGQEVTGKTIANLIGLKPRDTGKEGADLRSVINALRRKGYPVCANGAGYYYPRNRSEIEEYIASLQGRIDKTQEALDGMVRGLDGWDSNPEVREVPENIVVI